MILTSLKTNVQAMAYPPSCFSRPTLQNYVDVFAKNPFCALHGEQHGGRGPGRRREPASAVYRRPMRWHDIVRGRSAFCF